MTQPLPDTSFVDAAPEPAAAWGEAAQRIPPHDAIDLYRLELQAEIREAVRAGAPGPFDALVEQVEARLRGAPHLVVVRGLRWDAHHHMCVALNSAFGDLFAGRYQPPRTQIVHHLRTRTELPGKQGPMTGAQAFHSDAANFSRPADLLSMVCVRPDAGGGGSTRVVTTEQVRALIRAERGPEGVRWFEETVLPWRIVDPPDGRRHDHDLARLEARMGWRHVDPRGEGVAYRAVLAEDRVLWRRSLIEDAYMLLGREPDPATRAALGSLEDLLSDPPDPYEHLLQAGDFMIADNLRTLHTRTALTEGYGTSPRLMLRCWIRRRA